MSIDKTSKILLATDLGPGSDRALNRSLQLAKQWQARIIGLHVMNPRTEPDQILTWAENKRDPALKAYAHRQLSLDLERPGVKAELRIMDEDNIASCIATVATETGARLVVLGSSAGGHSRLRLGTTAGALGASLTTPLLVVRKRVHAPYRRILVATDFSQASHHALLTAASMFPYCQLSLYHCVHAPHLSDSGSSQSFDNGPLARQVLEDCKRRTPLLPESVRERLNVVIENGDLESKITQHVRDHEIDLVVMGNSSKDTMTTALIGSNAESLLAWLPCDAMLVRAISPTG